MGLLTVPKMRVGRLPASDDRREGVCDRTATQENEPKCLFWFEAIGNAEGNRRGNCDSATYGATGVMVAHLVWGQGARFKSGLFHQSQPYGGVFPPKHFSKPFISYTLGGQWREISAWCCFRLSGTNYMRPPGAGTRSRAANPPVATRVDNRYRYKGFPKPSRVERPRKRCVGRAGGKQATRRPGETGKYAGIAQ